MASIIPKLLYIGNDQQSSVYSAPATVGSYAIVKSVNIANTNTSTEQFSIHLLEPGTSANLSNAILKDINITGANVFSYETSIVIPSGGSLYIMQSNANLTFTISGVEYAV